MRAILIALFLLAAAGLSACGIERKPIDPNLMLAPHDRPQSGSGLLTGEDGEWVIDVY
ncbi:MAG: hypothetical protein AB7P52_15085 [Alphaproteobacteria bacterium]